MGGQSCCLRIPSQAVEKVLLSLMIKCNAVGKQQSFVVADGVKPCLPTSLKPILKMPSPFLDPQVYHSGPTRSEQREAKELKRSV